MTLALVTGLVREARVGARAGLAIDCAGPGPNAARRSAERLIARGATMLVSFGYAGGLDPSLVPGDLVIADRVVAVGGEAWTPADANGLAARLAGTRIGVLVGTDAPIATIAAKVAMAGMAIAVDMESHAVAAVALSRGVPFLVVRAIVDPAHRTLPDAALAATAADGTARIGRMAAALAGRPQDFGPMVRLAGAVRRADRSLSRAAEMLARL